MLISSYRILSYCKVYALIILYVGSCMEVHIVSQGVLLKIRGDLTSRAMIGLIERYTPEEDGNVERI